MARKKKKDLPLFPNEKFDASSVLTPDLSKNILSRIVDIALNGDENEKSTMEALKMVGGFIFSKSGDKKHLLDFSGTIDKKSVSSIVNGVAKDLFSGNLSVSDAKDVVGFVDMSLKAIENSEGMEKIENIVKSLEKSGIM